MNDTPPAIDWTCPVCTRSGEPVEILTTKGRDCMFPVMGYIGPSGALEHWSHGGRYSPVNDGAHKNDLVQAQVVYINVYPGDIQSVWPTRAAADARADGWRAACIKVQYRIGQFDD